MNIFQVALQQGGGPDRRAIAVLARILIDNGVQYRVNDSQSGYGPTAARGITQPFAQDAISFPKRPRLP